MADKAPGSYPEWTAYMKLLSEGRAPEGVLALLEQGSLPDGAYVTERFQRKIVETVNAMLRRSIRRFSRRLSEVLENNEPENAGLLCVRLKKELDLCFFFRRIHFLSRDFSDELEEALLGQIRLFWENEIRGIRQINELAGRPELEDLMYSFMRFAREYGE